MWWPLTHAVILTLTSRKQHRTKKTKPSLFHCMDSWCVLFDFGLCWIASLAPPISLIFWFNMHNPWSMWQVEKAPVRALWPPNSSAGHKLFHQQQKCWIRPCRTEIASSSSYFVICLWKEQGLNDFKQSEQIWSIRENVQHFVLADSNLLSLHTDILCNPLLDMLDFSFETKPFCMLQRSAAICTSVD